MKKIIRSIKDLIKDNLEDIKRHIPRDIIEDKKNDLLNSQILKSLGNLGIKQKKNGLKHTNTAPMVYM